MSNQIQEHLVRCSITACLLEQEGGVPMLLVIPFMTGCNESSIDKCAVINCQVADGITERNGASTPSGVYSTLAAWAEGYSTSFVCVTTKLLFQFIYLKSEPAVVMKLCIEMLFYEVG